MSAGRHDATTRRESTDAKAVVSGDIDNPNTGAVARRRASTYSTGGGGTVLEHRYGATLLAALLTGEPVDLLDTPFALTKVTFQDRVCPVDDVVIEGTTSGGDRRVVAVAVRRNPVISDRNHEFLALLARFVQVVREQPSELHASVLRLGLAVADPHSGAREVRRLTELARDRTSAMSFWTAVDGGDLAARERRRCHKLLAAVAKIAALPAAADGPSGELVWQLLQVLYVLLLRIEGDVQPDWTRWAASLGRCTSSSIEADRLLAYLYELTGRKAPGGAEITRDALRQQLAGKFVVTDASAFQNQAAAAPQDRTVNHAKPDVHVGTRQGVWPLVGDVDPRDLGVHPAIVVPGAGSSHPTYVPRALDGQIRATLKAGTAQGCFVVLLGGSCVGKTRAAFEAVLDAVPDWRVFHPVDAEEVRAFAVDPTPRTVLWLDEMHNYLGGAGAISEAMMRSLRRTGAAVIVIGTLWPDRYLAYTALPAGDKDPYAGERALLRLADIIDIPAALSGPELAHAEAVAESDPRIRVALASADYGMTQVLAAAPHLVRRWESAPSPTAAAVITAAVDARRMGIHQALTRSMLEDAATGYLAAPDRAAAPRAWFDKALQYATQRLHGATAALSALADDTGAVTGYVVADYLVQRGTHTRRASIPPNGFWSACAAHVDDPSELFRLGMAAEQRGLTRTAELSYAKACSAGEANARDQLVRLLCEDHRVDEAKAVLTAAAANGAPDARQRLAILLEQTGDLAEATAVWRSIAVDDPTAYRRLAAVLERDKQLDAAVSVWQKASASGVFDASRHLADLLERHGRVEEAIAVLRQAGTEGNAHAWDRLVQLLRRHGMTDQIEWARRQALAAGVPGALGRLIRMLELQHRHADVDTVLRQTAKEGRRGARAWLARRLELQGETAAAERTLRDAANDGDESARHELQGFLYRHYPEETEEQLQQRVAEGEPHAEYRLAEHLARRGEPDRLIQFWEDRAHPTDPDAQLRLAQVLERVGRIEDAVEALHRLADAMPGSSWNVRSQAADLLDEQGNTSQAIDVWRRATAEGERDAWAYLAWLLEREGRDDEAEQVLREAVAADQPGALCDLAWFLAEHGELTEIEVMWRQATQNGDDATADRFIQILLELDQPRAAEELLRRVAADVQPAAQVQLAGLLERLGKADEAIDVWRQVANTGDHYAREQLADLLEQESRLDEAIAIRTAAVEAGERDAREQLVRLFERCGRIDEAAMVWREGIAAGEPGACSRLAGLLERYGRETEAAQAWSQAINAGELLARSSLVRVR